MTLTKNRMVREIGRRTRIKNREVAMMLKALVEVWTEELVSGGRIELEKFIILETKTIDRGEQSGHLLKAGSVNPAPRFIRRIIIRSSKHLRAKFSNPFEEVL